jgi:cytochrome c peroxidase
MRRLHWLGAGALAVSAAASACGSDGSAPLDATTNGPDGGPDAATTALCTDGKAVTYPPEPYEIGLTGTLPNLSFEGESGPVLLADFFEPCAPRSRLLVIRSSTLWCGTCRWHAAHTTALLREASLADRIVLLDLLVADEDNLPATVAALGRLRTRLDAPEKLAIDPPYTFREVGASLDPLPRYVIVDTRTMQVRTIDTNPNPDALHAKLLVELDLLDARPRRDDLPSAKTTDGLTDYELELVREMKTPGAPPPDPTNEFADVATAATLGKKLFSDVALSPSGTVSCATCHDAAKGFSDGLAQSVGVAKVNRNSPSVALASHARWQFWDGRADTLWMQALGPFEDGKEIASSRLFIAHQIADRYAAEYGTVFAKYPLPDLSNLTRFPASGKPGDPSWQAMTTADQDAVTRVYVNAGKAVAAFERTLRVKPNALDRYAAGDRTALDAPQKKGLEVFFKTGCAQCHWGPQMTDDAFHVIRFPTGRQDGAADRGRADGVLALLSAEFTAGKKWSDAPGAAKPLLGLDKPPTSMLGAFKTPTLRSLPKSGPYGHGGTFATLGEVTKHYGERGLPHDDTRSIGATEPWVPLFDTNAQKDLVPFLEVLAGEPVE